MHNHLTAMLRAWAGSDDRAGWVLGTVFKTEGSAYRKAGAMTLIDAGGRQYGLLSGGCLEVDIVRNALTVLAKDEPMQLVYDGNDEDDLTFQLGIGCGGRVHIMLQPLAPGRDLGLGEMAAAMARREGGLYHQKIGGLQARFTPGGEVKGMKSRIEARKDGDWLVTPIAPEPHLLIAGAGVDAVPVLRLAKMLGWHVTIADSRFNDRRAAWFEDADMILHDVEENLRQYIREENVHAAILMSHNLDIDAASLNSLQETGLDYVALLGPRHRYREVLEIAGLSEHELTLRVSAPAGLDIGGELPESIALSILAEAHAALHERKQALPLVQAAE